MTSNAKRVAQWWSYRTRHQSRAPLAETQWLEYGQPQRLSSTEADSIQPIAKEDNVQLQ